MKTVILSSLLVISASNSFASSAFIPCGKQIAQAAVEALENSDIVETKGSVTLEGGDSIQKSKGNSWTVAMMYDDPCYATARVTLVQNSCTVKSVKILYHECTDN